MVSFQCDACADTVKKPQLDKHRQKCWASFTCLDCSTTFAGQDYKSHTSCITEAEKYQGALYKAPKKGKQSAISAYTPIETSVPPVPASPAASVSAIHPSRLNQFDTTRPAAVYPPARGGRGGFSSYTRRGGYGHSGSAENTLSPQGGMRTWGSNAVNQRSEGVGYAVNGSVAEVRHEPVDGDRDADSEKKKKKKRKNGDKGGTGSKANSSTRSRDGAEGDEDAGSAPLQVVISPSAERADGPKTKKRKRGKSSDVTVQVNGTVADSPLPDKTLKRLRKNMTKLEKSAGEVSLRDWLELAGQGKEKVIQSDAVLRGVKVSFANGGWLLSV